jgi:hypothetical protein
MDIDEEASKYWNLHPTFTFTSRRILSFRLRELNERRATVQVLGLNVWYAVIVAQTKSEAASHTQRALSGAMIQSDAPDVERAVERDAEAMALEDDWQEYLVNEFAGGADLETMFGCIVVQN